MSIMADDKVLNIPPDNHHLPRPQPAPRSPLARSQPAFQNDLNAPTRGESIDDNTKVPGCVVNLPTSSNLPANRRRRPRQGMRRYTLSIIEKELEEAKRQIEAKIDPQHHGENIAATNKEETCKPHLLKDTIHNRSSETELKMPYTPPRVDSPGPGRRSEKVYARYVQEGDRNLMLIYEPKESKSEIYCKQIGNKNVIVHLNMSSNLCQLIDPVNKGIIPLDSEGEVWLEVKRRSQLLNRAENNSNVTSLSDNLFADCDVDPGIKRRENDYVANISHFDSYVEGKVGRLGPAEHSDISGMNDVINHENEAVEDEDEGPYDTISIKERGDSLMIKFEKWNQHGVLNSESIKDSPILGHKKVIDFLANKGNNFDVSICNWEYEKDESVYSYISNLETDAFSHSTVDRENGDYDVIPAVHQLPRQPAQEAEASTFGPLYDFLKTEESETDIYSRTRKARSGEIDADRLGVEMDRGVQRSVSEPANFPVENEESVPQKLEARTSDPEKYLKKPEIPSRPQKPPPNKPVDLSQQRWYHGKIEKHVAKERLKGKEHGSFLVRDSANGSDPAHKYTIEFIDGRNVKKLMIMKTQDKFHFKEYEDKKFDRVELLIYTIMTSGLEVKDSACNSWKNIVVKPVAHL